MIADEDYAYLDWPLHASLTKHTSSNKAKLHAPLMQRCLMFCLLAAADFTYLMAISLASTGWPYMAIKMPWVMLSVGCGLLDIMIIWQYFHYGAGVVE